jgi:hypothetical protein
MASGLTKTAEQASVEGILRVRAGLPARSLATTSPRKGVFERDIDRLWG